MEADMAQMKPDVKTIKNMSQLPALPDGQHFYFKPASTIDQARGVCARVGVLKGWWLKNRVYYNFALDASQDATQVDAKNEANTNVETAVPA
jgi:hypothetical protein